MAEYEHQPLCDYCNEGVSLQNYWRETHEGVEYQGHQFCLAWLKKGYGAHDGSLARIRAEIRQRYM